MQSSPFLSYIVKSISEETGRHIDKEFLIVMNKTSEKAYVFHNPIAKKHVPLTISNFDEVNKASIKQAIFVLDSLAESDPTVKEPLENIPEWVADLLVG